ncbi:hypothetical protein SFC65_24420 [Priestia filamentosa]|uniref:hypothetical protein n=1 Tax=Priestia filamentosa TaxID=1402861 RepID=UPI00398194A7
MINTKRDIEEKLSEKGVILDNSQVNEMAEKLEKIILEREYWDIVEEIIKESSIPAPLVAKEGEEYKVRDIDDVKPTLRNKRVKFIELQEDKRAQVYVLEGRLKDKTLYLMSQQMLKEIETNDE